MDDMKNMDEVERKDNMVSDNMVSTVLVILAWLIFIGGFIAGIVCGRVETGYLSKKEFSLAMAAVYWISSFAAGMLCYGVAEIVRLLDNINTVLEMQKMRIKNPPQS